MGSILDFKSKKSLDDIDLGKYYDNSDKQIIYLDFDGAETYYNNAPLDLNFAVQVEDSKIDDSAQAEILAVLNEKYQSSDIFFTLDKPLDTLQYSTVYIGMTDAFNEYGTFAGMAETIDKGNQIKNDNAFVFADQTSDISHIISVIDHEVGHIAEGKEHKQQTGTISDFAATVLSKESRGVSISVSRSGGRFPGSAYAETKYWSSSMPNGADYANIVIKNEGTTSSYGWESYRQDIYVTANGIKYTISVGQSKTFRITSNTTFAITREAFLKLEATRWVDSGYKVVAGVLVPSGRGYYLYANGKVTGGVSISATYWDYDGGGNNSNNNGSNNGNNSNNSSNNSSSKKYDLAPYKPSKWSSAIVASSAKKTNKNGTLRADKDIYVDIAVTNKGKHTVNSTFYTYLYVDGKLKKSFSYKTLEAGYYLNWSDVNIGKLSAGTHTFKVKVDAKGNIKETNESNNVYSKKFTVKPALPNLVVKNISVTSGLTTEKSATVKFTVSNTGKGKASKKSYVYIYDGSRKLGSVAVSALGAGKSQTKSFKIAAGKLKTGTHTIKLVADARKQVTETSESNTWTKKVKVVKAVPDLTVKNISITANPTTLDTVTLKFTVSNSGNGKASKKSYVYIYDGSRKLGSVAVSALAAGKSVTKSFKIAAGKLKAGKHTIKLVADAKKVIKESNESNTRTKAITVLQARPDLKLQSVTVPSEVMNSDAVTLKFTVTNSGRVKAAASYVCIYDGSKKLGSVAVSALAAGKSVTKSFTIAAGTLSSGSRNIKLVADGTSKVAESNESNNTVSRTLSVAQLPADLTVSSFTLPDGNTYIYGDKVTLDFTITNAGKGDAAESTAYITYSTGISVDYGTKLLEVKVAPLRAGESRTYSCTVDTSGLSVGKFQYFWVIADGPDKIAESSEFNGECVLFNLNYDPAEKTKSSAPVSKSALSAPAWELLAYEDINGDGFADLLLSDGTDLAEWENPTEEQIADLLTTQLSGGAWEFGGISRYADGSLRGLLLWGGEGTESSAVDKENKPFPQLA